MAKLTLGRICKRCGSDSWAANGKYYRCSPCRKKQMHKYYTDNKENICKKTSEYQKSNRDKAAKWAANWRKRNPEQAREWARDNRDKCVQYTRKWQKNNQEKVASIVAKYRAAKLQAVPNWVDEEEQFLIDEIYDLCRLRTELTGIIHHVDHTIPLNNKYVCGLHTPANLQILTAYENISKGNKYE